MTSARRGERHESVALRRMLPLVVLLALVASTTAVESSRAQVDRVAERAQWQIARLHYAGGGDWYSNPSSLPNLHEELARRLGIAVAEREAVVTLDDERLFSFPLLYVTGHGTFAPSAGDLDRLRRFLDAGGMLWVDDNYGIDDSFRAAMRRLYPDRELVPIGSDFPIYSAYYELPGLPKVHEHDGDPAQGFGIFEGEHLAVFYSWSSDIGDGIEDAEVHEDPPAVREAAMRMAINVCVFAMTQP